MTQGWRTLLAGMAVWFAHFGVLWTASSVFGSGGAARLIALAATLLALGAVAFIAASVARRPVNDPFDAWMRSMGLLGCGLAGLSILWQAAPAAIG